jgi:hypothetical protein
MCVICYRPLVVFSLENMWKVSAHFPLAFIRIYKFSDGDERVKRGGKASENKLNLF